MKRHRHGQMWLNAAYYLLFVCMVDLRPSIGGLFKLIAFLVLTYLLIFVVVRSGDIWRFVVAYLQVLPAGFIPLAFDWQWLRRSPTPFVLPHEPSLSPLSL